MTIDETNLLVEKAKLRKDGIYSFRGNLWVVKDNKFIGPPMVKMANNILKKHQLATK